MYIVDNLGLRKPEESDVKDLMVLKNDEKSAFLLGGIHRKYSQEDICKWINFHNNQEDELLFVIVDLAKTRVVGHVGIYKIDYRIRRAEIGILLGGKSDHGKGWGTKVTRFMTDYAFKELGLHKVKASILKENLPSYYMFKKCGYIDEGILVDENYKNGRYYDVVMMAAFE